jgi:hypothetical protein
MGNRVFKNLARMALSPLRERGFVELARSVRGCVRARADERREGFDRRFGTDTDQRLSLESLRATGADVPALWRYWPTLEAPFHRMMHALEVPPEDFVFVDLGSGKGRVLMMAAEHPFQRIIGVELSPALHRIAGENLQRYHSPTQRCHRFELQCADAADFVPPPENTVFYLFQPFPRTTMAAVLTHLGAALDDRPRRMVLVYMNPLFHRQVLDTGWFALQRWGAPAGRGEFPWAIYQSRG